MKSSYSPSYIDAGAICVSLGSPICVAPGCTERAVAKVLPVGWLCYFHEKAMGVSPGE